MLSFLLLAKHFLYSVEIDGKTYSYYYYDWITWVVLVSFALWLFGTWAAGYLRYRKLLRRPQKQKRPPVNVRKAKDKLSRQYLGQKTRGVLQAVGIGEFSGDFVIQMFVDENAEDAEFSNLPENFEGVPVTLIRLPQVSFINSDAPVLDQTVEPIRDRTDVLIGGISGANTNLSGQCGTIGYFCRKKTFFGGRPQTYLLSNAHVFRDLAKLKTDEYDMIVQPSPGESTGSREVAELAACSNIQLDNDIDSPNYSDASIAKLWKDQIFESLIPMIGSIKGVVGQEDVVVGERMRKFGRTSGYTTGNVSSIYLDIWVKYDRTGQTAFFKDQILIEPENGFERFVGKGDSGSLLADSENNAAGLIFAGAESEAGKESSAVIRKIRNCGVANRIEDVMDSLGIDLIFED